MKKNFGWKIERLRNMQRQKTFAAVVAFIFGKLTNKALTLLSGIARSFRGDSLRQNFQSLWETNSAHRALFHVNLVVSTFFDLDGANFLQGGAERYTIELSQVIHDLGGTLEVYQCGHRNWCREHSGIMVYGLDTSGYSTARLSQIFHKWVPKSSLTIYYQMNLSEPVCHTPSICVSHGVDWDAHWLQNNSKEYDQTIARILASISNADRLVSVDTNTINWLRATDTKLADKCVYIPNFVDTRKFSPLSVPHENFTVLYPRRLSEARGFRMTAKCIPALLERYSHVRVLFCGKAEPFEQAEVSHLCEQYPGKVEWFDTSPDDMHTVFQSVDLVIIPTLYSEGTSLSCLEAMATKRPVIATNVGGLPNMIVPDYNGLLIEPNEAALFQAICRMIDFPELRNRLADKGFETAGAFDISIWRTRWKNIILQLTEKKD